MDFAGAEEEQEDDQQEDSEGEQGWEEDTPVVENPDTALVLPARWGAPWLHPHSMGRVLG